MEKVILDYTAIYEIIIGSYKGKKIINKLKNSNNCKVYTTKSSLIRAIMLVDRESTINNLQYLLEFLNIVDDKVNYKNDEQVENSLKYLIKVTEDI